ncbi:MAG TPA: TIGR01777 family oxidoreductase [Chthonomonadaceae bacterium]|nr:TIGR01777 family oxidoreductase [Chthonomonadaceae bacterium]
MKIVVTGATGFIGRPLCMAFLEADHAVTVLSRDANKARGKLGIKVRSLTWGADASEEWKQAVAEADVVVHLAGEGVGARRWTPEFKETLRASRVETTRALVEAMRGSKNQPGALISASAVGYYGDRGDETLTEESPPGSDFLAELGTAWEAEAQKAEAFGARVARMRLGIVLGGGGALERMLYPFPALPFSPWKLGLGGPLGSGRQWMSWVHLADAVGMFFWAATNARVQGAVNVTAPNPVTNAEFSRALGRALHRPAWLPLPGFALKAIVGEFAETLLGGQKALPTVAQKLGYAFQFSDIDTALRSVLQK